MTILRGRVWDKQRGVPLDARVQVLASTGEVHAPADAVRKVGPGEPFFYAVSDGFEVDVPGGPTRVTVERGTEYTPLQIDLTLPWTGTVDLEAPLARWIDLPARGWFGGNTHVHYSEVEQHPLDRLRLDPRVEDLPVLIVSVLQRRDIPYASNVFPIGPHALSTDEHVIDVGEESRHNTEPWRIGLGHIMLINIRDVVQPLSRGLLVDDASPDYPPLVDACDGARTQGGLVLWCHSGNGMEAPIAAALGKLDGLNLFDPYWMDPEYDLWYALLNCGMRLPASTGSDWFVCSSNRVYVTVGEFSYSSWLAGLAAGRTFITNGPVLGIEVEGHTPSNDRLDLGRDVRALRVRVTWAWHAPLDTLEIVRDGQVVASCTPDPAQSEWNVSLDGSGGWLAARAWGTRRNSYGHALWAHTSPVYLRPHAERSVLHATATRFVDEIDAATAWIGSKARFDDARQRQRMLELFADGREVYAALQAR